MTLSRRGVAWALISGAGLLVPAAFLAGLVVSSDRLDDIGDPPQALVAAVAETQFDESTGVTVALEWTGGPALLAPQWSGTVGAVQAAPGGVLASGDPVATIGGVQRLAIATPQPFHRPLARRDTGIDVAWLQDVLVDLGHLPAPTPDPELLDADVLAAVRALAADLGVRGRVDAFDPGWFVWLPDEPFALDQVTLVVAGQAPSAGAEVATGPPVLRDVAVQPLEGGALRLTPGTSYELVIGDEAYPLDPTTSGLGQDALAGLAQHMAPLLESTSGTVRRADPVAVWAIPAAAIQAGADGRLCIWTDNGTGFESLPVQVFTGTAGVTLVEPAGVPPPRLLTNPADVLQEPACPSV